MVKRHTIFQAFSWLALLTILSKLLGFAREAIIASYFGTSIAADMFYVALIIPTIAFTVIGSTVKGRMLPLYIEKLKSEIQQANEMIRGFSQLFIMIAFSIVVLICVSIKPLINVVAPGFGHSQVSVTIVLTLIMLPMIFLLTLTSISQVIYHANESFTIPAVGPLMNNVFVIISIFVLYPWLGLYSLAFSILLGSLAQFIYQWVSLPEQKFMLSRWRKENLISSLKLLKPMIPIIVAAIALQLNTVVDRLIASFLEDGSIAALNYSYRLLWIPLSILLIPITTIIYPKLSHAIQATNGLYTRLLSNGLRLILFLSIPFAIVMIFEAENLVSFVYERGEFDQKATLFTSGAFVFYTIGLLFIAVREYFVQHFYVVKQYKIIMIGSVIGVLLNIIASISLAPLFSINGIAFATTLSMIFQSIYYFRHISRDYRILNLSILIKIALTILLIILGLTFIQDVYAFSIHLISITLTTIFTFLFFYLVMRKSIFKTINFLKGL